VSLVELRETTVFDAMDGEGVILDLASGELFGLNRVATVMLETLLRCDSYEEMCGSLRELIEVDVPTIMDGVQALLSQLRENNLLVGEPSDTLAVGRRC